MYCVWKYSTVQASVLNNKGVACRLLHDTAGCYGIVSDCFVEFKESLSWNCWYTTLPIMGGGESYILYKAVYYANTLISIKVTCMGDYFSNMLLWL